jgi:hypothetical protein
MHEFYPLKPSAPVIHHEHGAHHAPAPSLSPDILIAFVNDPLNPYFGDFVTSSPSISNKLGHVEAAPDKFVSKLRHYHKHHEFPSRVCYPLVFERSGYIHPAFDDFIDLFARCSSSSPQPHTALQLRFADALAITFTTAALLRSASHRLLPRSLLPFIPPKPLTVPACWALSIPSRALRALTNTPFTSRPTSPFSAPITTPTAAYPQPDTCPAVQPALRGAYSPEYPLLSRAPTVRA